MFLIKGVTLAQERIELAEVKIKFSSLSQEAKNKIETITSILKGVSESNVQSDNKTLIVKYDPEQITSDMLVYTIRTMGYIVDSVEEVNSKAENKADNKDKTDKNDKL